MTAIRRVRVTIGADGLAYYTTIYGNGEKGSRSEGYGRTPEQSNVSPADQRKLNLAAAIDAAHRDYPDTPVEADP